MKITDQLNRTIYFDKIPKRIISLVPSQTELLVDLGLEESLVGLTKFCIHPVSLRKSKTVVGGTKQIHIEKIKALKPDLILCNKEENTKDIVEACEVICNVHVSDIFNIEDSIDLIKQYGTIFNRKENAKIISSKITQEAERFETFISTKETFNTVYFIWKNPWMVAANNTFINYLLGLNNYENFYKEKTRYSEIVLSMDNVQNDVNLVLLSSEPFPFKDEHKKEVQEYYPNARIIRVDGEMFSWYGSRLTKAFSYFKNLRLSL